MEISNILWRVSEDKYIFVELVLFFLRMTTQIDQNIKLSRQQDAERLFPKTKQNYGMTRSSDSSERITRAPRGQEPFGRSLTSICL